MIILYFDGGIKGGNPGGAPTYGWVLEQDGVTVAEGNGLAQGPRTNNVAEWAGLIAGLRALAERGIEDAEVRGDSELVINQMTGVYRCKAAHLRAFYDEAQRLRARHVFRWVPRELNKRADELAGRKIEKRRI